IGRKEVDEGIREYREAVRSKPDWVEALNNLAWLLATHTAPTFRNGEEAIRLAQHAVERTGHKDAETLDTLAASYAEAGRFAEAAKAARQGLALAQAAGQKDLAAQIQARLQLYQSGKAYREP